MSLISAELSGGVLAAGGLRNRLDVSPATLMRMIREAGPEVVQIGRGRATRYAWRQLWPGLDVSRFPLVRVDENGTAHTEGELLTLAARQTGWMPGGAVFQGLPPEIMGARPSGFLGRHFATAHPDLRLPPRLPDWSNHHVLLAMSRRGEDVPGNLIVGDESFARWQTLENLPVTHDDYPRLAEATIAGDPPGSSAGGDRPKFGALRDGRQVLVKFARRGDAVAERWCDLLALEALALETVSANGITVARTHIVDTPSHRFLESERFDRIGVRGRIAVISMAAAHDDLAEAWTPAAIQLRDAGRLSADDARRIRWLDAFGALIANTDRHQYNIVFFMTGANLRLAPAFDQFPALYAPSADGQVLPRTFTAPPATADTLDVWDEARSAAREYWRQAGDDRRLSDAMRTLCAANARTLAN
jgi:hypothetical protein